MPASDSYVALPLSGYRIGVTAARKADEQAALLERRGAQVVRAPALSGAGRRVDEAALRAATEEVLARPVDVFVATTGIGVRGWFARVEAWGMLDRLLAVIGEAEILARGPKSVGALRQRGLRELWSPESEELEDVLARLRGRDLAGLRIVVQEHGQSLSTVAKELRERGADVLAVAIYRVETVTDAEPMLELIEEVVAGHVQAVTFTSAPAVAVFLEAADSAGRAEALVDAFAAGVIASCVGPVTAAAFDDWQVPTIYPDRSRLLAMIKQLTIELPARGLEP